MNFGATIVVFFSSLALARSFSSYELSPYPAAKLRMAVEAKDEYNVAVLRGDGIGPEIVEATLPVLSTVGRKGGFRFNFKEADIGGIAIDNHNDPFPKCSLEICKSSDSILLGAIGGCKWDSNPRDLRPESGLLKMRSSLGLFANLRPAKVLPQLIEASTLKREVIKGVDIMVVRELTGGIYFGTPKGIDTDPVNGIRRGYSTGVYTEPEVKRIAEVAFTVAQKRNNKVCSVDKANVLEVSQLWRDVIIDTHKHFADVELSHMYVDNCAMQLIRYPLQFDTIVTGNMFGDILSDEASMLVGSLGMLPSASIGSPEDPGVFEPCHGSAPDIAGEDKANPLATILSAAMMLRYDLNRAKEADMIERAVEIVLDKGIRTRDIHMDDCKLVGCIEMGREVVAALENL